MRSIIAFSLTVIVTSVICKSQTEFTENDDHIFKSHMVGDTPIDGTANDINPAIFDLKLYKDGKFMRTCKGFELQETPMWMTAAECLDSEKYDTMVLEDVINDRFKEHLFHLDQKGPDINKISYEIHPRYNNVTKEHNIALFSPTNTQINIPVYGWSQCLQMRKPNEEIESKTAEIFLKWKNTTQELDMKESYEIHSIKTKIISSSWCKFWYSLSPIKKYNACVSGWYRKGLDKNDVGSPLVIRQGLHTLKVIGIATIIRPWTHWFGLPIEFLSLDAYRDWILSVKWYNSG